MTAAPTVSCGGRASRDLAGYGIGKGKGAAAVAILSRNQAMLRVGRFADRRSLLLVRFIL